MSISTVHLLAVAVSANDTCTSIYTNQSANCADSHCAACFNTGARPGKRCNGAGKSTGYYCPSDTTEATGDITFACMDWTFGSTAMQAAEAAFVKAGGDDVFFGVGTYGTGTLGACYRLKAQGVAKDIIAQSINTGHDVAATQFDLQIGAGGAGAFNTCAGAARSMYDGGRASWGCQYGGVDNRSACAELAMYPRDSSAMKAAGDSLVALCEYGWDQNVRLSGAGKPAGECKYNPTLEDVARVRCPEELVQLTWIQRTDEPASYRARPEHRVKGFPSGTANVCSAQVPGAGADYCLTRMMDCRKPSGAFKDNIDAHAMASGRRLVQTCTADGYTRIDVQCGCNDCYC